MEEFFGAWRLVSFEERQPDGRVIHPYGRDPVGLLIYEASGRVSVQIMKKDRALSSIESAVEGFTSFFGAFEVDRAQGVVIHHVEGHLLPQSVGKALRREFEFAGDRLILKPAENRRVTWERIRKSE
jgi:hypothetical protein